MPYLDYVILALLGAVHLLLLYAAAKYCLVSVAMWFQAERVFKATVARLVVQNDYDPRLAAQRVVRLMRINRYAMPVVSAVGFLLAWLTLQAFLTKLSEV
jgi:hypothetical protein